MILYYEDVELDKLSMTDLELRVFSCICERSSTLHTLLVKDLNELVHSLKDIADDRTVRKALASLTAKGALFRRTTMSATCYLHPNPYVCWKGPLRNRDYQRDVWDVLKQFRAKTK